MNRRKLLSLIPACLLPTPLAEKPEGFITAGDPGADMIEVIDRKTGVRMSLVQRAALDGSWIEQLQTDPTKGATVFVIATDPLTWEVAPPVRLYGDFELRPKKLPAPQAAPSNSVFSV